MYSFKQFRQMFNEQSNRGEFYKEYDVQPSDVQRDAISRVFKPNIQQIMKEGHDAVLVIQREGNYQQSRQLFVGLYRIITGTRIPELERFIGPRGKIIEKNKR